MPQWFSKILLKMYFIISCKFVLIYLDDILIFSKDHKTHVLQVLQRLWRAEKCEFHVLSITFLGFILEGGQVRADPPQHPDHQRLAISQLKKKTKTTKIPRVRKILPPIYMRFQ